MQFDEILVGVVDLLQRQGRVSYRALKLRFQLDEELLAGIKDELIDAQRIARDEDEKVLVWVGEWRKGETAKRGKGEKEVVGSQLSVVSSRPLTPNPQPPAAERRQLTVMFCDLVGSTALSAQLDPEDLREVIRRYQDTSAAVIERFGGHIAQYLGDGLLVYFGYPVAHEDDAARAVRVGLHIIDALQPLKFQHARPLQVRIGIHTGLVVVGEMGGGQRQEQLALGETPNIAARVQGTANPDEVMISAATYHLVEGLFVCEERGQPELKGVAVPLTLYRVVKEGEAQSRFQVAVHKGLIPLIGREHEYGLLQERWARAKEGEGQVVLLSGEPGIGKSRLVQALMEHVLAEGALRIEFRCSAYHQNSAFYPILEHLQRLLRFAQDDAPQTKLEKLQQTLAQYRFPQADTFPLLAALLSLPHPDGVAPLTLSPQKQKQKTQEALVAWIIEEAEKAMVYCAWEDLHWADPSTLEVLTLFLDQVPTARLLAALTFRPEFTPPWKSRSHISHLTLNRLGRPQVEAMVEQMTGDKTLPVEVVQQIVIKTDGVPLFVEELTKSVVETVGVRGRVPPQSLDIPATLQDSLMARLDRLGAAKEIVQLGAVLGREFSYQLLHAVSAVDEETLQHGLKPLVEAELVYQRGVPPQATYLFKHALIQDTAYQSLLKSIRQHYHRQIATTLEAQFPQTVETHPEVVAHHYTEAGLVEQALPYWQQAGRRAAQRSANVEAVTHLRRGLALVKMLPKTPERDRHELALQAILGPVLIQTQGWAAQETGAAYTRAAALCQQPGETAQRFPVLYGVWAFQIVRADHQTARTLGEQLLHLAEREQAPALLVEAHFALGETLLFMGEPEAARRHCEQSVAHYDAQQHSALAIEYGQDPAVSALASEARALWALGYPEQALRQSQTSVTHARGLAHPFSLAFALGVTAWVHQYRREWDQTQEQAEITIALATEHGFPHWVAQSTIHRGRALAEHGHAADGIDQMRWGITAMRDTGSGFLQSYFLCMLAEAYLKDGQVEEGLATVAEALAFVDRTEERFYEAELYRIKGTLTLEASSPSPQASSLKPLVSSGAEREAEGYFLKAIDIAQKQQAKSLELRAATSLARLWQQQGKSAESHHMLSKIYNWFTEGFETKDLQEAKALLESLISSDLTGKST